MHCIRQSNERVMPTALGWICDDAQGKFHCSQVCAKAIPHNRGTDGLNKRMATAAHAPHDGSRTLEIFDPKSRSTRSPNSSSLIMASPPSSPRSILKRQPHMNPLRPVDAGKNTAGPTSPSSPGAVRFAQEPKRSLRRMPRFRLEDGGLSAPASKPRPSVLQIPFDRQATEPVEAPILHDCSGDWLQHFQSPRPAESGDDDVDRQLMGYDAVCEALGTPVRRVKQHKWAFFPYPGDETDLSISSESGAEGNTKGIRKASDESLKTMISSAMTEDEEDYTGSGYFQRPLSSPRIRPYDVGDDDVDELGESGGNTPELTRSLSCSSASSSSGPSSPTDEVPNLLSRLAQSTTSSKIAPPKVVYRENPRHGEEGRLTNRF
ncbi:hypothetical protein NM688_g889 [Phlebia brevispora]|uniref:Uncharacterized protein n=1 Tax=Phlebia brevispora TaxID=194682 RepID=A0ACC1TDT7_9APHY|nr:hypothetical protein NM688_g889 [Phlebia brevispora]